jgi:AcrR family transcriptional regulator
MNVHSKKIDGRSLRAQKTYNEAHEKLVSAAIALYKNPLINKSKITITMIAKDAGVSVATAYNHFPDNKLDILGSIFRLGFEEVSEEYLNFIKKNDDPLVQLNKFLALVGDKIIEYGDAVKYAFFNFNELLESEKWIKGEPYDVSLNSSIRLAEQIPNLDPHKLADEIFANLNGRIFLWMRFNPRFDLWSKFTDEWFTQEVRLIVDKALKLQK